MARRTRIGWLIMQRASEYNDEYYYFSGGGTPVRPVLFDRAEAERELARANAEASRRMLGEHWETSGDPCYLTPVEVEVTA